ncbi:MULTISPECIES: sensor histidine kinase [unclassified Variovorax]|uniref:sensor histidine kinase n=1 Tax=unclassified Variovorax TaxID=663243 RepID=UPI00076C141D|nr:MULTISPECIES: sensor histidine kinase [unclassified Variovorax]KWT96815.1 Sensor histidine kinase [Variovorax sp. WDL1]PNG47202.1 Sensor histidine kinase YycG [Variovorax sp. B2]PNG48147.1 Sensor histidine kinase YycG [Variovorax sp. B4]VTV15083.1 Sensor histidine kinase YycG [Variovorax sp. WDL1]
MQATPVVIVAAFGYLALLFAIAHVGDRRAREGRSLIGSPWIYTLSMGVYCTAWTYFGSIGRAASSGLWFLPIYLGPTLGMLMAWTVLRKMIRIARSQRITSIADFIASRHGKSPLLAMLVTLIAVVGILPYIALQLKAIASGYALLVDAPARPLAWWSDSTLYIALVLAGFTVAFGARHLDTTERHEGMVAAIAFESLVKLIAFIAVGAFVTWGLFDGPADLFGRAAAQPELARLLTLGSDSGGAPAAGGFAGGQWFALTLLAMFSMFFLPRQFQMMVVENVDERHVRRATWAFPLYLLLINLFVLPIAIGGLLHFQGGSENPETFVLSLPLAAGQPGLALAAFIGGLSAATGMVIVEAIAISTMVCNDLVMPLLLRAGLRTARDLSGVLLGVRRTVIVVLLLLGYFYYRIAGEDYALVSIGLISFAAVAQFAPPMLAGMYWKGGTRDGALAGLGAGFLLWAWTLMLPSIAKSGWIAARFVDEGPFGIAWLRPEQLLGLAGLDNLTHALFWSLLANTALYFGVSLLRRPSAREASQALTFVDALQRTADPAADAGPVFWRGTAKLADLRQLATRFLGAEATDRLLDEYARRNAAPAPDPIAADARLVQFVERQLAGAIGGSSARLMVASVVQEEDLQLHDVMSILDEASREAAALRAHSQALEEKSLSLERATAELSQLNEQLKGLDRLKDDFMSSVTHELRTPLTSIRALAELMLDDPAMDAAQRQQFLGLVVAETERLTRLVNQVLDMAKIEAGAAEWRTTEVDLCALARQAVQTTQELFHERGATVSLRLPAALPPLQADPDRMMQVLVNLLSNAAKFVPPGSGHAELCLRADGERVVCTVCDNGPGVPRGQRELVFEKFRQGGDAANRPQGTGLGLPISRRIVEHYGGRMWLDPASGEGACFGFELPLRQETAQPETDT